MPTQNTIDTLELCAQQLEDCATQARRIAACIQTDPDMEETKRLDTVLGLNVHADGLELAALRLRHETHQRTVRKAAARNLLAF